MVQTRGESYALSEISAFVLRQLRTIAEDATGKRCSKAVDHRPGQLQRPPQRNATMGGGPRRGGSRWLLRVLNEPTAAALAYGYGKRGS